MPSPGHLDFVDRWQRCHRPGKVPRPRLEHIKGAAKQALPSLKNKVIITAHSHSLGPGLTAAAAADWPSFFFLVKICPSQLLSPSCLLVFPYCWPNWLALLAMQNWIWTSAGSGSGQVLGGSGQVLAGSGQVLAGSGQVLDLDLDNDCVL